jgi:hypothetical protein
MHSTQPAAGRDVGRVVAEQGPYSSMDSEPLFAVARKDRMGFRVTYRLGQLETHIPKAAAQTSRDA